jgi:hypothetical protein
MARLRYGEGERVQAVVWCSRDWSARALCLHGKGGGVIDAIRSVQLLGGSIVVCSMWKVELRLVSWRQIRKAARRESHRQLYGTETEEQPVAGRCKACKAKSA